MKKILWSALFFPLLLSAENILFIGNSLSVLPEADHFGGMVYRSIENSGEFSRHDSYSRSGWNTQDFIAGSRQTTRRKNLSLASGTLPALAELLRNNQSDWVINQLGTNMFYYLVYYGKEKIEEMLNEYLSLIPVDTQCVWILPPHIGYDHIKEITLASGELIRLSYNSYQYYMEKVMAEYLKDRCFLFDSLDLEEVVNGDQLPDYIHYHGEQSPPGVQRMELFWAQQFLQDFALIRQLKMSPTDYNRQLWRRVVERFELKKNLRSYFSYQGHSYSFEELRPLKGL